MKVTALSCWHKERQRFLDLFYVKVDDGELKVYESIWDVDEGRNEITDDVDLILEKSALPSERKVKDN